MTWRDDRTAAEEAPRRGAEAIPAPEDEVVCFDLDLRRVLAVGHACPAPPMVISLGASMRR